jgi:hypothetical protein
MGPIRFDGLYVHASSEGVLTWFRFYPDGVVVSASTTAATPAQVARWLRRGHPHSSSGQWRLDEERLTFDATCSAGTVEYSGDAYGDTLILGLVSRINGYTAQGEWRLCPLDPETLDGQA